MITTDPIDVSIVETPDMAELLTAADGLPLYAEVLASRPTETLAELAIGWPE